MFRFHKVFAVAAGVLFVCAGARWGWTYTQSGASFGFFNGVPMGHEWVTRMAAVELLGYTPVTVPDIPDPNDPRPRWTQGRAKNTNLSSPEAQAEVRRIKAHIYNDQRYLSRYKAIYDAIIGERWVDIAGYNVVGGKLPGNIDCWDAVAQEPAEVQYDHFMRRYDDTAGQGGVNAASRSRARFIDYFVAAATARPEVMNVYDGGGAGSTAVDVDRNYFLFGRAVHLFEDSFSSEHTVRIAADNYTRVRQVKSYLCAPGSEQHSHSQTAVMNYTSGDVIWKPGTGLNPSWLSYKASNMKTSALVAVEATKDLWAAFIRTMGTPMPARAAKARAEATTLANNWLSYDANEMTNWYNDQSHRDDTYVLAPGQTGKGRTVQACMASLNVGTDNQMAYVRTLEADQRKCVYNAVPWAGYTDLFDPSVHMYFAWQWRSKTGYDNPPANWSIPNRPADTGVHVRIKSVANRQYMTASDGISPNAWVYVKPGSAPLDMVFVGTPQNGVFRVSMAPRLFLSYINTTGAVKLYDPGALITPTDYILTHAGPGWSIKNVYWQQYMFLNTSTQSPYINRTGNPSNSTAQWFIEGLTGN